MRGPLSLKTWGGSEQEAWGHLDTGEVTAHSVSGDCGTECEAVLAQMRVGTETGGMVLDTEDGTSGSSSEVGGRRCGKTPRAPGDSGGDGALGAVWCGSAWHSGQEGGLRGE